MKRYKTRVDGSLFSHYYYCAQSELARTAVIDGLLQSPDWMAGLRAMETSADTTQ